MIREVTVRKSQNCRAATTHTFLKTNPAEYVHVAKNVLERTHRECLPTNDSAQITSEPGYVIVEANEWDQASQRYRTVTLRLCLNDARLMANTLLHQAAESEMLRRWVN